MMANKTIIDNIEAVIAYMQEYPNESVVSIYDKLKDGMLCSLPINDTILYAYDVKNWELLPFMGGNSKNMSWSLIWTKINEDRRIALESE